MLRTPAAGGELARDPWPNRLLFLASWSGDHPASVCYKVDMAAKRCEERVVDCDQLPEPRKSQDANCEVRWWRLPPVAAHPRGFHWLSPVAERSSVLVLDEWDRYFLYESFF